MRSIPAVHDLRLLGRATVAALLFAFSARATRPRVVSDPPCEAPAAGQFGTAAEPVRASVCLQRDAAEPGPDALGAVGFRTRNDEQSFSISVRNLDAPVGAAYAAFLESAAGSGVFASIGDLALVQASKGRWSLSLVSTGAPPPPLGVAGFAELEGRRIEVRNEGGTIFLWAVLPGTVPAANLKLACVLTAPKGAPLPDASGSVKLQFKGTQGCSKLDLKTKGLLDGPAYDVWIETATRGSLELAGTLVDGRLRLDTKRGSPLPLGVSTVGDLVARGIEIRDGATVVLAGSFCAPPPASPLVYFDSDRDGQIEIYSRGLTDSSAVRVTNFGSTDDYAPAVSADGQWIAFSRADLPAGTPTELWKVRSDGTNLTQLTSNGADQNDFPTFRPDGTKIVWSQNAQLWVMDADGSNQTQLTFGSDFDWDPSYNFDGTKIVFSRHGIDADLWVMDADGTDQTLLLGGPGSQDHPTWCRAAGFTSWIVFEDDADGDDEIFVLDTGTPGALPLRVTDDSVDDDDPVFLVDGPTLQVVWEREVTGVDSIAYRAFPPAGPLFQVPDNGNNRRPATAGSP